MYALQLADITLKLYQLDIDFNGYWELFGKEDKLIITLKQKQCTKANLAKIEALEFVETKNTPQSGFRVFETKRNKFEKFLSSKAFEELVEILKNDKEEGKILYYEKKNKNKKTARYSYEVEFVYKK